MHRSIKVKWIHDFPDEPVCLYSELDSERWETRKVETPQPATMTNIENAGDYLLIWNPSETPNLSGRHIYKDDNNSSTNARKVL